jgi:transposase
MFALYEQGHGTHAIASRMERSKHTVYGVLTHRKTRSLPERPVHPVPEAGKTRDTKAGKRKREREDTAKLSAAQGIEGRLLERLEPQLERAYGELLREDPVVARQILGSVLWFKIPAPRPEPLAMASQTPTT